MIDLTDPSTDGKGARHKGIRYLHVVIKDEPGEDLGRHLRACADFIRSAHRGPPAGGAPGRVLVHCLHGISRSASQGC